MSHQHDGKKNGKRHSPDTSHPSAVNELAHEHVPSNQPRNGGRDNQSDPNQWKPSEKVMTVCTGIIAFCTLIYSVFAGLQWWEIRSGGQDTHTAAAAADLTAQTAYATLFLTKRLNEQTLKEMQKQSKAMQDASDAAEDQAVGVVESNRLSRQSLQLDQRSWISVDPPVGTIQAGQKYSPSVTFTNTGRTPATNVIARVRMEGRYWGVPPDFTQNIPPVKAVAVMSPRNGISAEPERDLDTPVDTAEEGRFRKGELVEFIFGSVNYDDIFSVHHRITFCYYLAPDLKTYKVCDNHNEIDRNGLTIPPASRVKTKDPN